MAAFTVKKSMQYPNVLIDEIMPLLKPSAVKVMNVMVRNTFGRQKLADEMSFTYLESLTNLRREAIAAAVAELERLEVIVIRRGSKGKGSNVYTLNIDPESGVIRKPNQFENRTSSVGSSKSELFQTHTKPILLFPIGNNKAVVRTAADPPDPRIKELIAAFSEKYLAKTGKLYVPMWGKDGHRLKGLLRAGVDTSVIHDTMDRYFSNSFYAKTGFDISGFVWAFNRLSSAADQDSTRVVSQRGKYDRFK